MCGDGGLLTTLSTLIDNNLLVQEEQPDGEPRFTMLETIHAYALELLGDGAGGRCASPPARRVLRRACGADRRAGAKLAEHRLARVRARARQFPVRARLAPGSAGERARRSARNRASRISGRRPGRHDEARPVARMGARHRRDVSPSLRARVKLGCREPRVAPSRARPRARLWRSKPSSSFASWTIGGTSPGRSGALGIIAELAGDFDESDALAAEAEQIFRELGHEHGALTQTHNRALAAIAAGDYVRARPLLEQSLARCGAPRVRPACRQRALRPRHPRSLRASVRGRRAIVCTRPRERAQNRLAHQRRVLAARASRPRRRQEEISKRAARLLGRLGRDRRGDRRADPGLRGAHLRGDREVSCALGSTTRRIAAAYSAGRAMSQADAAAYALATVPERAPL